LERNFKKFKITSNETEIKSKKFVFQINPENIKFVDSLSYEDKNIIINQLITNYKDGTYTSNKPQTSTMILKYVISISVIFIILIPVLFFLLNSSMNATKTNYKMYQGGFEKLFKTRN
jgi:ATP-dependent Zn protease